jgi:hypothetical protein
MPECVDRDLVTDALVGRRLPGEASEHGQHVRVTLTSIWTTGKPFSPLTSTVTSTMPATY